MRTPIQYGAEASAAMAAWVFLEPNEEERTEGAVEGGGQNNSSSGRFS